LFSSWLVSTISLEGLLSGQKDRYMLHMHRTRDRVFLLINMILCQCH
jgi:hypothetical protein